MSCAPVSVVALGSVKKNHRCDCPCVSGVGGSPSMSLKFASPDAASYRPVMPPAVPTSRLTSSIRSESIAFGVVPEKYPEACAGAVLAPVSVNTAQAWSESVSFARQDRNSQIARSDAGKLGDECVQPLQGGGIQLSIVEGDAIRWSWRIQIEEQPRDAAVPVQDRQARSRLELSEPALRIIEVFDLQRARQIVEAAGHFEVV